MKRRLVIVCAALGVTACQNMPDAYAPPVQRQPFENFRPYRISRIVHMSDGDVDSHIVRGISGAAGGSWRWTDKRAEVRVALRSSDAIKYYIDFTVADATFKETGPVTISFFANDHLLDRVRYDKPGDKHFEKPVPAEWIPAGKEAIAAAEIDKVWVAKQDGAQLGFILSNIGFTQ